MNNESKRQTLPHFSQCIAQPLRFASSEFQMEHVDLIGKAYIYIYTTSLVDKSASTELEEKLGFRR